MKIEKTLYSIVSYIRQHFKFGLEAGLDKEERKHLLNNLSIKYIAIWILNLFEEHHYDCIIWKHCLIGLI